MIQNLRKSELRKPPSKRAAVFLLFLLGFCLKAQAGALIEIHHSDQTTRVELAVAEIDSTEILETTLREVEADFDKFNLEEPKIFFLGQVAGTPRELQEAFQNAIHESYLESKANSRQPSSKRNFIKKIFSGFNDWFFKHYRISLAVTRFVVNATVATYGIMVTPGNLTSLWTALPVGILAGGLSGSLQYFNEKYLNYITKTNRVLSLIRGYGVTVVFVSIADFALTTLGIIPETSIDFRLLKILTTAGLDFALQYPWELGIGKTLNAKLEQHPEQERRLRLKADLQVALVSAVSILGVVATLKGMNNSQLMQMAVGGAGLLFYRNKLFPRSPRPETHNGHFGHFGHFGLSCSALFANL